MNTRIAAVALGLLAAVLSGCISSETTSYQDVERVKVSFETEKAGRVFYETLSKVETKVTKEESKSSVNLILINLETRTVTGPNKHFNQAVAMCDTDQNGKISELEAEIFAVSSARTAGR